MGRLLDENDVYALFAPNGTARLHVADVDALPRVDAKEVVHGRWEKSEPGYRICSHCKADVAIFSDHRNYCPNCGAKMDLEDKE